MQNIKNTFFGIFLISLFIEGMFPTPIEYDIKRTHIGRGLTSIYSPLDLIGGNSGGRLLSIPQRIDMGPLDYFMADETVVAILDSGINLKNKWIMDRVLTIGGIPQIWDLTGATTNGEDRNGHGTLMASIILSINPHARLVIIKCLDMGAANENAYVSGLRLAHTIPGINIINISGGGRKYSAPEKEEIDLANDKGILVVAASGNESSDLDNDTYYPASLGGDGIISVANLEDDGGISRSSNYGSKSVDVGALGTGIPGYNHMGGLIFNSGTSQAAAMVTGVASVIKGYNKNLDAGDIKKILINTATPSRNLKYGRINASRAVRMAQLKEGLRGGFNAEVDAFEMGLLLK